MKNEDHARELFIRGYSCSQAVFAAYSEELGLGSEWALRIAAPFRAGMGRMGKTCGAVTGALMVLGLKYGEGGPGDNARKDLVCGLVQEFHRAFSSKNGSCICNELLGCDISDPGQMKQAAEKGIFFTLCPELVRSAAEIVGRMIENDPEKPR